MSSNSALERTINKVLSKKETELISQIDAAYQESLKNIEDSKSKLEAERTKIIESAKKQAENLKRQIVGSSRLNARNKELLMLENDVNEAFEKAKARLMSSGKEESYKSLMTRIIEDSLPTVGSDEVVIECNKNDSELVKKILAESTKKSRIKTKISDQPINVIGGVRVKSADNTMTFDNTLDSRIERLKPLIRKNVARMLRGTAGEEE
ncbi:MAG: V-type ATP synthase subunit E [Nitrososphaera sp.]|jgi:V/A-type H+-transporting ATPase subunit E|nr:V-type ATP synthase subunit E [Nitrososphaera sp.]